MTPASGCLEVNHNTSITIVFHPVQCDSYAGTLFITYSTGDDDVNDNDGVDNDDDDDDEDDNNENNDEDNNDYNTRFGTFKKL